MPTQTDVDVLELKLPPIALIILVGLSMWLGAVFAPGFRFQSRVASVFGLSGVIACALGLFEFKRAKTTVNPTKNLNRLRPWPKQGSTGTRAIQIIWDFSWY